MNRGGFAGSSLVRHAVAATSSIAPRAGPSRFSDVALVLPTSGESWWRWLGESPVPTKRRAVWVWLEAQLSPYEPEPDGYL